MDFCLFPPFAISWRLGARLKKPDFILILQRTALPLPYFPIIIIPTDASSCLAKIQTRSDFPPISLRQEYLPTVLFFLPKITTLARLCLSLFHFKHHPASWSSLAPNLFFLLYLRCIMVAPALFTAVGIGAALVTYVIYHQITYTIAARKFARTHGCKPPTKDRLWDPILGLDFVISTIRASRGKYQLLDLQKRLARLGSTFTLNILGESLIFTDEPKNVQAVLATQFPDYDVGELRRQATVKLLGHGIFNADGPYWEHSRALIRPNFVRKQVGDLRLMEHHVMHMISYLPADGTPVDIQSFFFRMVSLYILNIR